MMIEIRPSNDDVQTGKQANINIRTLTQTSAAAASFPSSLITASVKLRTDASI